TVAEPAQQIAEPVTEEQQFVEVWRPARAEDRRPRRHHRPARDKKIEPTAAQAASPAVTSAENVTPRDESPRRRDHRRTQREASEQAPPRDGSERSERRDRSDRRDRRDQRRERRDDDRPPRTWEAGRERRGKEPDPNSPFAKLAALKAQLEADAKDRR